MALIIRDKPGGERHRCHVAHSEKNMTQEMPPTLLGALCNIFSQRVRTTEFGAVDLTLDIFYDNANKSWCIFNVAPLSPAYLDYCVVVVCVKYSLMPSR